MERELFTLRHECAAPRRTAGGVFSVTLHGALLAWLLHEATAAVLPSADRPEPRSNFEVVWVPPDALTGNPDDVAIDPDRDMFEVEEHVRLGEFDVDIAKIRERRDFLFPFMTTQLLALQQAGARVVAERARLVSPFAPAAEVSQDPPLDLAPGDLQAVVDRSWARRGRWRAFAEIAALSDAHNPDTGLMPDVVRGYLEQNILQPFCESEIKDPPFWAMLENASEHADFVDFVSAYLRRYPSSRTSTELLFVLDKLARGNRDVLAMLLRTDMQADLSTTAASNPKAFDLAIDLADQYRATLERLGVNTLDDLNRRYGNVRLRILSTIVDTTPGDYRLGDAWFLIGEVHFEQNNLLEAFKAWRRIVPNPEDAFAADYDRLLTELDSPRGASLRNIRFVLDTVYGRWKMTSVARMRQFGFSCDDF